jgi:hypothetical protein
MSADVQTLLQQAKQLTSDERVELIKGLENSLLVEESHEKPDYLALFGSGRGALPLQMKRTSSSAKSATHGTTNCQKATQ